MTAIKPDLRDSLYDLVERVQSGEYSILRYTVAPCYADRSAFITIKVSSVGFAGSAQIPREMDLTAPIPSTITPGTPVRDLILDEPERK